MNTLSELANQEEAIFRVVASQNGLMEEKGALLDELGVYAQYRAVFGAYLGLLSDPDAGLEALKRALFLSWYELTEPACFTGIWGLPAHGRHRVLQSLNSAFANDAIDDELRWMLSYYYRLTDIAFPSLDDYPELAHFLRRADPESFLGPSLNSRQFDGRGQMGRYWRSILASNATLRPDS